MRQWVALALVAVAVAGCGDNKDKISGRIVGHLVRPGGGVEAVTTIHDGGGATVGIVYEVYISRLGNEARVERILSTYHAGKPVVHWNDKYTLAISISCGSVYDFKNVAWPELHAGAKPVWIKLENQKLDCW